MDGKKVVRSDKEIIENVEDVNDFVDPVSNILKSLNDVEFEILKKLDEYIDIQLKTKYGNNFPKLDIFQRIFRNCEIDSVVKKIYSPNWKDATGIPKINKSMEHHFQEIGLINMLKHLIVDTGVKVTKELLPDILFWVIKSVLQYIIADYRGKLHNEKSFKASCDNSHNVKKVILRRLSDDLLEGKNELNDHVDKILSNTDSVFSIICKKLDMMKLLDPDKTEKDLEYYVLLGKLFTTPSEDLAKIFYDEIQEKVPCKTPSEDINVSLESLSLELETQMLMREWYDKIVSRFNEILEKKIIKELSENLAKNISPILIKALERCSYSFFEYCDRIQLKKIKNEREEFGKLLHDDIALQKRETIFHDELLKLMKNTRSPYVCAQILAENVQVDQTGAASVALLLRDVLNQRIMVSITNKDEETFCYIANHINNDLREIKIHLVDQHYGSYDYGNKKNDCLYWEIIAQCDEILKKCPDDKEFRITLGKLIQNDADFCEHIRNGWHSIAFDKKLYGGKMLPKEEEKLEKFSEKEENKLKGKINHHYKNMISQIEKMKRMFGKQIEQSHEERYFVKMKAFDEAINVLKTLENADRHLDRNDLKERKLKVNSIFGIINDPISTLKRYGEKKNIFNSGGIDRWIGNLKDVVEKLINLQEQRLSKKTWEALRHAHLERPEVEDKPLQQFLQQIATSLQLNQDIFPPLEDQNNNIFGLRVEDKNNNTDERRGLHTVAAGVIPADKSTLYLAFNYLNWKTKKPLGNAEKEMVVTIISNNYGSKLKSYGIKKIKILERVDTKDKSKAEKTLSTNTLKCNEVWNDEIQTVKRFHFDIHAEMFFPAQERILASKPQYTEIEIGVGKASCIRCHAYFGNVGIYQPIRVGEIQGDIDHHIHPNEAIIRTGFERDL